MLDSLLDLNSSRFYLHPTRDTPQQYPDLDIVVGVLDFCRLMVPRTRCRNQGLPHLPSLRATLLFILFIWAFTYNCFCKKKKSVLMLNFCSSPQHITTHFTFQRIQLPLRYGEPPQNFYLSTLHALWPLRMCPFFCSRLMLLLRLGLISFSFPLSFYAINFPFSY